MEYQGQWEYKVWILRDSSDPTPVQDTLNLLGSEGWELVYFAAGVGIVGIFKRPK